MLRSATLFLTITLAFCQSASAGFNKLSSNNVAVYWGQNSYQQASGQYAQQRLAYYCANSNIDIIPLAFLISITDPTTLNFANAEANCTVFTGSTLLSCPQIGQDIHTCQRTYGKTIMLSIGGSSYTQAGFSSPEAATAAADELWSMFGPPQIARNINRPFGNAVVDGFDLDFESTVKNAVPFAAQLRKNMDTATAAGAKPFYLSAAPQCPYPDVADEDMLGGAAPGVTGAVAFDFLMVQYYNNPPCQLSSGADGVAVTQNSFSSWDTWARTVSKNPKVRVLIGMPGGPSGAGTGYVAASDLGPALSAVKRFASFGGVMMWDMSQAYANPGFLDQVASDLGRSHTASSRVTTSATSSIPAATSGANSPSMSCHTSVSYVTSTLTMTTTRTATRTMTVVENGTLYHRPPRPLHNSGSFNTSGHHCCCGHRRGRGPARITGYM